MPRHSGCGRALRAPRPPLLLAAALALLAGAAGAPEVSVEFYYSPSSPKSGPYLNRSLGALLAAGLPGSAVRVTVLPWPAGAFVPTRPYLPTPADNASFPDLCALRGVLGGAAPADSQGLAAGVRFAACRASAEFRRGQVNATACAELADLRWDGGQGLEACAQGGDAEALLSGGAYGEAITRTMSRTRYASGLPAIFLDGDPLTCPRADLCDSVWTEAGHEDLERPGSLLAVVCSRLSSAPPACEAAASEAVPADLEKCENCAEVGRFRWGSDC
ncbi:unnamed protein product, partial [Prorocentrum cordatum]